MDWGKFQLKRVNPFQGLIIDADTWRDAHDYHREQFRLHLLAFHKTGIVSGLEVTANDPSDSSVNISPGISIDPEGNVIVIPKVQRYILQTRKKGTVYLVMQFREIPGEPYQPPQGGQATRILEGYLIQERDKLPAEPYIELARFDFDPARGTIINARNSARPGANEINLNFREYASKPLVEKVSAQRQEDTRQPSAEATVSKEGLTIGHMVLGEAAKDLHVRGLQNLVRAINHQGDLTATFEEGITLDKALNRYNVIYLTGNGRFEVTPDLGSAMNDFLKSGGILFGDGCSDIPAGGDTRGNKEFGLAFNRLAGQLKCKLEIVQRGHPLLSVEHVFSAVPPGCDQAMLLEGNKMVYSGSDYGCAWEGGHAEKPLSREIIRGAFEMGANIVCQSKKSG